MKYVLYIDYRASYKPMYSEYRPMDAKNMAEAVIEADTAHNPETMYLIRIMKEDGKVEKVGAALRPRRTQQLWKSGRQNGLRKGETTA